MGQQSDNNLDALFQKAAEEYPLKTNNKNWDIVAAKLHTSSTVIQTKKSKTWQYAILLLLLLGGSFVFVDSLNKKHTIGQLKQPNTLSQKKDNSKQQNENKTGKNQLPPKTNKNSDFTQANTNTKKDLAFEETNTSLRKKTITNTELPGKRINNTSVQFQITEQPKLSANDLNNNSAQSNLLGDTSSSVKKDIISQPDKTITQNLNNTIKPNSDNGNNPGSADTRKSKNVHTRPQPKTFYGAFFFAPDFSTIKFQHINKPGYSIGVALGYRINSRLSAEIGLQRVHANFYSDGKYFDTSNLKLKKSTKLDALNGNNKLTEVPIALRYNLSKNYRFFITGGTTVALITHNEKYDYNVIRNGTPRDVYRKFSALTGTKFFSSVNVSFGYQAPVSNFFDVKVEPYFQAATKGLGIGDLPVSNFGVNIGIVKDLK